MDTAYMANRASRAGSHWFDPATRRFFNSRVVESTWTRLDADTWRFVSGERQEMTPDYPRRYTVREIRFAPRADGGEMCDVHDIGAFQAYASSATAARHLRDGL